MAIAWDEHKPPELDLIADCVHCGFCLPTCPSYAVFEEEMDSPRGRIVLMRIGHEEDSEVSPEMTEHFDRCLGCMACVTACPSGVQYDRLIERVRPQLERQGDRTPRRAAVPAADLRAVHAPGPAARDGADDGAAGPPRASTRSSPRGSRGRGCGGSGRCCASARRSTSRSRSPGCRRSRRRRARSRAGSRSCRAASSASSSATSTPPPCACWPPRAGRSTRPREPRCCGSLMMHAGVEPEAQELARQTIAAYEDFDFVAVNVSGCGSGMKEYDHLLSDDPEWADRAEAFVGQGPRRPRAAGRARAAGAAAPAADEGRLPRRLPPRPRPAGPLAAARAAARHPRAGARRARRLGDLLRLGRDLQPRPAGGGRQARRAQGAPTSPPPAPRRSPPPTPAARSRSRPTWSGTMPIFHPMTLLDLSIRGERP